MQPIGMSDCSNCPPSVFCGYPDNGWFPLAALNPLCSVQVIFLIENLELLEDGQYPSDPKETGYTGIDPSVRLAPRFTPRWVSISELYSEITWRLSKTGAAGRVLKDEIQNWRKDLPINARDTQIEYWKLGSEARTALNYICGAATPAIPFENWRYNRKFTPEEITSAIRFDKLDQGLTERISLTGDAGEVLIFEVKAGFRPDQVCDLGRMALDYCCRHRKQTFAQHRASMKKRAKEAAGVS